MGNTTKRAIVTGASGLVGSAMVELLMSEGFEVWGIDNNLRRYFFGEEASTEEIGHDLTARYQGRYHAVHLDIRDRTGVRIALSTVKPDFICHAAAQPSHDWSIDHVYEDFDINAVGTLNMLQAYRDFAPEAIFVHVSTSKVYGDNVNDFMYVEHEQRFDLSKTDKYYEGITEELSIQNSKHSPFGASKTCGDIMAQEFGQYFNLPIAIFRPVCITGPSHKGAKLHGYLSYLVKCIATGEKYVINGYKGKQVRDNIHAKDLVRAFYATYEARDVTNLYAGAFYNIGGGRRSNNSILEAIVDIERILNKKGNIEYSDLPRRGDHIWCIFSNKQFQSRYKWELEYDNEKLLIDLCKPYL